MFQRLDRVGRPVGVMALVLLVAGGCGSSESEPPVTTAASGGQGGAGGASVTGGSGPITITIFHTSDEHGRLERATVDGKVHGGAADVAAWMAVDGVRAPGALLLSSGDNWTGPAISTYFRGESTVEVFNAMGYAASAIGNHEFDFGQEVLAARVAEANYPYLGANVRIDATGELPSYAIARTIVPIAGVAVGIIGLSTRSTATATNPALIADLRFDELRETLEEQVPALRAEGAELVVVLAHEGLPTLVELAAELAVPVDAFFGGHRHGALSEIVDGIPVIESGDSFVGYRQAWFEVDPVTRAVTFVDRRMVTVRWDDGEEPPYQPDAEIDAIVAKWAAELDGELSTVIGYSASGIELGSWQQANWVCDAWLATYPEADIVIQNFGGLRQAIASGEVRPLDLYGMMPFENRIYELELTGAQIRENIAYATDACGTTGSCSPAIAGLRYQGTGDGVELLGPDATPLDLEASYRVLVNDFIYEGGGGYLFASQDPTPVDLGVNYRDPVVEWTTALGSSESDPLEGHLDPTPRSE